MSTSGMHRRPFEGRHLIIIKLNKIIIKYYYVCEDGVCDVLFNRRMWGKGVHVQKWIQLL